jgi:hypothetical protein
MEFDNKFIEVGPYLELRTQPTYMLSFEPKYVYHTVTSALTSDFVEWSTTDSGEAVRIPIFAYKTAKEPLSGLFHFGLQLGFSAMQEAASMFPTDKCKVILVTGVECHDLSEEGEDAYRVYMGISVAREK